VSSLTYHEEDGKVRTHVLRPGETVIGRSPTCDLIINHPSVSRQHARIAFRDGRYLLSDLGSTFGTHVRDEAISGEVEIRAGDAFSLGQVELIVAATADGPTTPTDASRIDASPPFPSTTLYCRVDELLGDRSAVSGQLTDAASAARLMKLLSEIGKTLVTVQPLPQVLERVIDLVFEMVAAERAYLMLREGPDEPLAARVKRHRDGSVPERATVSRTVVNMVMRDRVAMLASDAFSDARLGLDDGASIHALNIRSFMCAPLWNRNDVIGVLYADNPRTRTFSEDDLIVFTALSNYAAVAIDQARLSDRLLAETKRRERLQRYHSPSVVKRILHTQAIDTTDLLVHERDVSVLFCDIVGFTSIAESLEPRAVADLLNEFFEAMTEEIFAHQGTLDKFIGDAILAVFGAPFEQPDHAVHAAEAALGMRRALTALNLRRRGRPLEMRTAIHSGHVLAGDIGSPKRREFTILGDTVNIASRLQTTVAKASQIVISGDTYRRLGGAVAATPLGAVSLRGRQGGVDVYELK
jgi:adenylate cyclase